MAEMPLFPYHRDDNPIFFPIQGQNEAISIFVFNQKFMF